MRLTVQKDATKNLSYFNRLLKENQMDVVVLYLSLNSNYTSVHELIFIKKRTLLLTFSSSILVNTTTLFTPTFY